MFFYNLNLPLLFEMLGRIFLPLGILLLFYLSLNRVHMTFAGLSAICNFLAFYQPVLWRITRTLLARRNRSCFAYGYAMTRGAAWTL